MTLFRYFAPDEHLKCGCDPDEVIVGEYVATCGECGETVMDAADFRRGKKVPGLMRWTGEAYVDAYTGAFLGRPGDVRVVSP